VGNIREKTVQFAKEKGWDTAKIDGCIASKATAAEVERNLQAGLAMQVQQTPTVFLNGRMLGGAVSWATLDTLIKMELNRPKEIPVFVTKAAGSSAPGAVAAH
jgi:protein-disulfide isomerase